MLDRHGLEAREFSKFFPDSRIYSFEPNPAVLSDLSQNLKYCSNVTIVPKAINSFDGTCSFFAIDPARTITTHPDGNLGASSLFLASGEYDDIERYEQIEISVNCVRLDTFLSSCGIDRVDAIWMDIQGAELTALRSLGTDLLETTLVIQTELKSKEIYHGQDMADDVIPFLTNSGFEIVSTSGHSSFAADYLFLRTSRHVDPRRYLTES
jgi:FkbM family methyltransferase